MVKKSNHWILDLAGILMILFILSGIWLGVELRKDAYQCYQDPIKCGAERIALGSGKNIVVTISGPNIEPTYYATDLNFTNP